MEILRFDEAGTSTPKRKMSSKSMILVGFVATVFGVGSALASTTISINSGNAINVGQGVSLVTACDEDNRIDISFGTSLKSNKVVENPDFNEELDDDEKAQGKLNGKPVFYTNNVVLSKVDGRVNSKLTGFGCGTQYFTLQIYYNPSDDNRTEVVKPYTCGQLGLAGGTDEDGLTVAAAGSNKLSDSVTTVTCTYPGTIKFQVPTTDNLDSTFTLPLGKKRKAGTTLDTALDISYFTLVSSNS